MDITNSSSKSIRVMKTHQNISSMLVWNHLRFQDFVLELIGYVQQSTRGGGWLGASATRHPLSLSMVIKCKFGEHGWHCVYTDEKQWQNLITKLLLDERSVLIRPGSYKCLDKRLSKVIGSNKKNDPTCWSDLRFIHFINPPCHQPV